MLEQKVLKIGETDFVIQQLPATRGMEVGIHLMQIIAGAAEGMGDTKEGDDFLDTEYNPAKMATGLMNKIDEKGTPAFIKTLIKESLIQPDPSEAFNDWYEAHYSANYDELFDMVAAIIDHNRYADMIKKKFQGVMDMFSSDDGKAKDSTRS